MDPDLRFCSHVLALSFNEKGKSFNLMVFILQHISVTDLLKFSQMQVWIF
jgi:hypothetical protein